MKLPTTFKFHGNCALLAALSLLPVMAATIPAELPAPDAKPPATDKPVKVYIQSGQSNSLGFGRVEGAEPVYSNIYLSPDPVVKTTAIPIGNSVIFSHGLFQSMASDAKPEWWKPLAGERCKLTEHAIKDGLTQLSMKLGPHESGFVVFPHKESGDIAKQVSEFQQVRQIDGPWKVSFDKEWFYPREGLTGDQADGLFVFEFLRDWANHKEHAVNHFYRQERRGQKIEHKLMPSGLHGPVTLQRGF